MNAVILAAGRGSRLGQIGEETPKPLIDVGGRPPLARHLENCKRHGVKRVFINTHHLAGKIRNFCGDGSAWGLAITYSFEPELLGTAGALDNFRQVLAWAPFFVIYGDNLVEPDLGDLRLAHESSGAAATIALHHREDVSTSGMVVCDSAGRITKFVEKPALHERISHLVNAGIYVLSPNLLDLIPHGVEYDFGRNLFPSMLERGESLAGHVITDPVLPVDTPELLEAARRVQ
jgi:mannose-1-phosphate guanylyltransferase